MPENNEFRLKFGGYVDQQELKKNVQDAISAINKENSGVGKGVKIPVFNINDIKQQGIKMVEATKDVKKELQNMFSSLGEVKVDSITNMNGQFSQFIATIKNNNQIIDRYVFKLAELQDAEGNAINAFVQMKKTNSDSGLGSVLTKQLGDLEKYKATIDTVLNNHIRVNGEKLLSNEINAKKITDEAVDAIGKIEALKKTAGYNTTEEMKTIKDIVNGLKAEGEEYYRIEKNQKNLIDSQTKEVAAVQNKVTALSNRYIDKTGSNQLFDTKNIEDVNNQIGKIMAKVSELRANTGRSSYDFEANMSVLNNMYDALEKNTKGYYKLETEQRKSSELYQKQDKDVQQYLLDVQKIKDTALNSQSGKRLLDEENIKTVRSELAQAEVILRNILNSHKKGDIVDTKSIDDFVIKMKQVNARISNLSDEETVKIASEKSVQSQLNALNRVEQKVKDIRLTYEDGLLKENNIVAFNASLKEVGNELDKLKAKAGSITEEEMRNLTNLTNKFKTTASILAESEKAETDFEKKRQSQLNTFAQYSESLKKTQETYLTSSSPSYLKDGDFSSDIKNRISELQDMLKGFKDIAGAVTDEQIRKYKELSGELDRLASRYANIEKAETAEQKTLLKQQYTVEDYIRSLKKIGETTFSDESRQKNANNIEYQSMYNNYLKLYDIVSKLQIKSQEGKIIPDENLSSANAQLKDLTQNVTLFDRAEKEVLKTSEAVRKQTNQIQDLIRQLSQVFNLTLDPNTSKALKDAGHLDDVAQKATNLNTILVGMRNASERGELLPVEQIDLATKLFKDLNAQVEIYKGQEGFQSGLEKSLQSQEKQLNNVLLGLQKIHETSLNKDSSAFLADQEHLDAVGQKMIDLNTRYVNFRNLLNSGNLIPTKELDSFLYDLQALNSEIDIINKIEQAERNAQRELTNTEKTILTQKYTLEDYMRTLRSVNETALNPKSSSALTNPDNVKRVADQYQVLDLILKQLIEENEQGEVISQNSLLNVSAKVKDLTQDVSILRREEHALLNANTSQEKLNSDIANEAERLKTFILQLKSAGQYTDEFAKEIDNLALKLANVTNQNELQMFKSDFSNLTERAKQFGIVLKDALSAEDLQQKIQLFSSQVQGYMQQNTRAAMMFKSSFEEIRAGIVTAKTSEDLLRLQNDFKLLQQNINNAGKAGLTFGQRMSAAVKKFMMWTGTTNSVMYLVRSIRQMITHTKELDSAMVSLKKVTDETDLAYKQIFNNATEKAKELNTSIKNIIDSTAEFAKLGFDIDQAQELASVANVYANVAEISAEQASKTLVSTINGFKDLTAENAWDIADIINNISNKFAASGEDLGNILTRSSAALSEANNDLNEAIALGTVAQTINVDADRVGTALKTLSLRIRGATAQLEKEGLDTEDMVETTADLRKLILASAGVDILEKDQKTFKSTYQILLEISKVWENIGDLERSALLQKLGGKMQANIVSSILNNGELLQQVYDESLRSAGSAMKEQERWSQSLEAKAGNVEAIFESISTKVFDSDSLKAIYDGLIKIMDTIDKLVGKGKGLQLLAGTIGGVLGGFGNGFINVNTIGGFWKEASAGIAKYNEQAAYGAEFQRSYALSIQGTNAGLSNYLVGLKGAEASLGGYIAHTIKATAASVGLKIATTALNVAINAGIMWLISVGFSALSKWINHNKELAKSFTEATEKIQSSTQTLKDYKESIDKIVDSESSETEKLKELNKIKDELADKYGIEIGKINDVTEARRKLNDEIQKQTKHERDLYLAQNKDAYEAAKKQVSDSYDNKGFWKGIWQQMTGQKALLDNGTGRFIMENAKIGKDVQALFDKVTSSSGTYKNKNLDFTLGIDSKDEVEYMKILEKTILEFYSISEDRKLNKDENALYKLLLSQFESLKNNEDAINNIEEYSRTKAERLIDIYKQGTMSNKEYLDWLISRAKGDEDVIAALKEIINESDIVGNKFESLGNSSNQILAEILSNYTKIGDATKSVREEIKTADEQFEKLTKTIDENKDVDKFFSASDIIEILDLYPDLNDAILETAYGYKIDQDAIEALRDAKLEEKKVALQTQLDETQGLLNTTKKKLDLYGQELNGIKSVAEARSKLAQLEDKWVKAAEPHHHRKGERADITAEMAKYNDYIDAAEAAEKYQEEIDSLSVKLKVLGTDFNKAKDATEAQTDALNTQKDSIKELNDEYKDAKDYIDDLIKLTMEYIKKTKELEKESLKTKIDEFKKLIDRQKELLKLQQQEKKFNDDLKDQNRDLLKIKQEIDALSVEGVEYSLEDLKRRAELEEQYTEQSKKRDDFLYDHEIEVREKALDDEEKSFTEKLETQIKEIEDYLDKEGRIRQDAIDLINGKSEEFYNNLLDYTMTYTDKSRYEFDQLWTEAYSAILKYADGELNVDLALMNLIASMKVADEQLKNIENSINNIKHATDAAKEAMYEFNKVTGDTVAKVHDLYSSPIGPGLPNSPLYNESQLYMRKQAVVNGGGMTVADIMKYIRGYHTGGIVEGVSTEHGEVLAKLLSGEVVATEGQARQFMEKTLPKLAGTTVNNNNASLAPVINMGDINISGNADQSIVDKLRSVQKDIVNDVFRVINNQKNIYNGGMIR